MPISSFGEHTPKHAKRETKVETRREGARDDRNGRRPRRDSSRRVRFVPFLARRRLSTGRVRPPSRDFFFARTKKKSTKRFEMTAKSDVCLFYACDEDSNEKDDATLAPLAPLAIRTPVVKLDDDTAAKFIFTIIIESFGGGGGVFVLLLTMRFVCFNKYGWCVVFAVLCQQHKTKVLFRFF